MKGLDMQMKIGFIGCGNMGGALARAASKAVGGKNIILCDSTEEKAEALAGEIGAVAVSLSDAAKQSDFLFLGVKPQMLDELFASLSPMLCKRKKTPVLVSMAAGISISAIEKMTGCEIRVIRIMPNTPVSVGAGMILYDVNKNVTDADISDFLNILSMAGKLDRLDESKIDAASAVSGCGPAYVYMFAEALADGGVLCGLPRDKANFYAAQTLMGAAKLLMESGKHAGELKDAVCSPGGTTIEGVKALEDGAFRASAVNAVVAAYEKTLKLKK